MNTSKSPVVILNMAHTGLGIARNLRSLGIGLFAVTGKRDLVGNHTRLAKVLYAPDSAEAPDELASFLCDFSRRFSAKPVLFPTRDQDVLFVERFRAVLEQHYLLPIPAAGVLTRILDKLQMAEMAGAAGIPLPKTAKIKNLGELGQVERRIGFPCVVKPISSLDWRGEREWKLIGKRKAFSVGSTKELVEEYEHLSQVTPEILIQELIPGPDSNLFTFGCYFDRRGHLKGSFYGRKLLQYPCGYGTGFLVESAAPSPVKQYSVRLLQSIDYRGIAECEFKLDPRDGQFKFIEVNVRHWDQHRLSTACGVNLSELAYLDLVGCEIAERVPRQISARWIADDSFLLTVPKMLLKNEITLRALLRMIRGKRVFGLFSPSDPEPFLRFLMGVFLPACARQLFSGLRRLVGGGRVKSLRLKSENESVMTRSL